MNWLERIRRAEERETFTREDAFLAGCFRTCAIGERNLPVNYEKPNEAYKLGLYFDVAIKRNDIRKAKRIYEEIQKLKA